MDCIQSIMDHELICYELQSVLMIDPPYFIYTNFAQNYLQKVHSLYNYMVNYILYA